MTEQAKRSTPPSWWPAACEATDMPLGCLRSDGRFLWVNTAMTELCGWSVGDLIGTPPGTGKRLQDLTPHESIGPEGESSGQVRDGKRSKIVSWVEVRHRSGKTLPAIQTVYRHPVYGDFKCFVLQLAPMGVSQEDMSVLDERFKQQQESFTTLFNGVMTRLDRIEGERRRAELEQKHDQQTSVNIGNTSTSWIVAIVIAMISAAAYFAYVGSWNLHHGDAKPPPAVAEE